MAAHVACLQLNYTRALEATSGNQADNDVFAMDEVRCKGSETDLRNCSHELRENCDSGEAAGVVCDVTPLQDLEVTIARRTEECYAKNVLFGPSLIPRIWIQPTVLDCQWLCSKTSGCNTFTFKTVTRECRLHGVGEVLAESRLTVRMLDHDHDHDLEDYKDDLRRKRETNQGK